LFTIADIADIVEAGVRRRCAALDLEQAVAGLDALEEVELHPIIAEIFAEAGYGVYREQRYPADRTKRRESEGERCDFVLAPDARPLRRPDAKATLFEPDDAVDPGEAFWLEMKVVAQFTREGPNRNYTSELLSTVRHDITKLSKDPDILRAGLMILLFVRDAGVAEHDLGVWQNRCLDRGLPIGAPSRRFVPITDRIGNTVCCVVIYPVSHL
jgi:hypothetical protein